VAESEKLAGVHTIFLRWYDKKGLKRLTMKRKVGEKVAEQ